MSEIDLLGPPAGYCEMLDHFTVEIAKKEALKPPKNPLRPSSAGKCTRELAFEYARFKGILDLHVPPESAEVQRIFKMGHAVESHLKWEFRKAFDEAGGDYSLRYGQQVVRIMKLQDGSFIEGSVDDVFYSTSFKALVDYKSKKDKFSHHRKSKWDEDNDYYREHAHEFAPSCFWIDDLNNFMKKFKYDDPFTANNIYQLNLYFHDAHNFFQEVGVDHCVLIYKNKNDSRVRELRFRPSKMIFNEVIKKFTLAEKAVIEAKNPLDAPKDFALGSVKCAFCNFRDFCHPEADTKKEYFATLDKKHFAKNLRNLPKDTVDGLNELYSKYTAAIAASEDKDSLEEQIITLLENNKCWKIRFEDGNIFKIKRYKTGGPKGGPRTVLKRDK